MKKTLSETKREIKEFNHWWKVGTMVSVRLDFEREAIVTSTKSEALLSSGKEAVIFLENVSDSYLLSRVFPIRKVY
jgi:hypothetical protein